MDGSCFEALRPFPRLDQRSGSLYRVRGVPTDVVPLQHASLNEKLPSTSFPQVRNQVSRQEQLVTSNKLHEINWTRQADKKLENRFTQQSASNP